MAKKKRTTKYWIGQIHLWLGLTTGLVVLIVSITGCLYVFQKEISEAVHKDKYFVTPSSAPVLPASVLLHNAQAALGPEMPINTMIAYKRPDRSVEFMTYRSNDSAATYFGVFVYFKSVFVNPYTGAVLGVRDYRSDFFNVVKFIHWSLLLNTKYGQPIVGISTLIFVLMLISGLILWWPKKWNRAAIKKSFTINWKASFKRVNYDSHNVPGFYTLIPALIISLTGLVFAFEWFEGLVYAAASGSTTPPAQVVVESKRSKIDSTSKPVDLAVNEAWKSMPSSKRLLMSPAAGEKGTIWIGGYKDEETYFGSDVMQFDQYTGKLLHRRNDSEKNKGEQLVERNYDIHVGAIAGIPGKILAFLASLICASLPVTGFLIWWGRRNKKKPARVYKAAQTQAAERTEVLAEA